MKVDFQMDCITNKNQEYMVAITHLNMQKEGKTVDCFLEDLENNILLHETITPENTGITLGAVELEKAYHIRIEEAEKWIKNFAYSHVIKKDCHLYDNSFISQTMSDVKVEAWNKEPDNGGYVVKYANMWLGYRTGSATVNLSQACLKASTNSKQGCNAFVYISTQNNDVTVDFGFICSPHSNGNWYPCYNIAGGENAGFKKFDDVIVTSTKNSFGEYLPNKDVTMQYTFDEKGNVFFTVNGKPYKIELDKPVIKKFDRSFLFMTSYVPILDTLSKDK